MKDKDQANAPEYAAANRAGGAPQGPAQRAPERQPVRSAGQPAPLLGADVGSLRAMWTDIQVGFVDDPRDAVAKADALVSRAMQQLTERFAAEQSRLKGQWSQGDDQSTEDLRQALQRYRSFFDGLLSIGL